MDLDNREITQKGTSAHVAPLKGKKQCPRHFPALQRPWGQLTCRTARICWFTVDIHIQVS